MDVKFEKVAGLEKVERMWKMLETDSHPSIFQSWTWMGAWLRRAVGSEDLLLCIVHREADLAGLAVLTLRTQKNRRLFPVKTFYLNESGPERLDFCIEYNGFLIRKGWEREVWEAFLEELARGAYPWEELVIRRIEWNQNGLDAVVPDALRNFELEYVVKDTTA